MQLSEINLSHPISALKQLLPTGEFRIVLRKSATNTSNNKICLYFLDDFFHWGLPGESQALEQSKVVYELEMESKKETWPVEAFLDS